MGGINYGRVIAGGLAAGVVANLCDFLISAYLAAEDLQRMSQRLGLDWAVVNGAPVFLTWAAVDLLYGVLIVWTYAAIRPRFGPGPATAVIAALTIYAAPTLVLFGFQSMGVFALDSFVKHALLSLVAAVLSGLVGAAIYQEAGTTGRSDARGG
jgi:hypothetical protein